jgi:hypothetical protein
MSQKSKNMLFPLALNDALQRCNALNKTMNSKFFRQEEEQR